MLNRPRIFESIYSFGFIIEYLTPACAARLIIKSILFFLNIRFNLLKSEISILKNLKFFFFSIMKVFFSLILQNNIHLNYLVQEPYVFFPTKIYISEIL